ncbi:hypothetical protein YC2023_114676 [Brassica napus]
MEPELSKRRYNHWIEKCKEDEGGVLSIEDEGGSTSRFRVANKAGRVRETATKQNAKKRRERRRPPLVPTRAKSRPMQFSGDIFGVLTDALSGVLSAGYHSSIFSSSSEFCHSKRDMEEEIKKIVKSKITKLSDISHSL